MFKQIFHTKHIKILTRSTFRFISSNESLLQADKPCSGEGKDKKTCEKTSQDKENTHKLCKCITKDDKPDPIKICVKDPCSEKSDIKFSGPPCRKYPCGSVVCDVSDDGDDSDSMDLDTLSSNLNDSKVVIIGAGLAGLSAAKYLQENQILNYTILEAQSRPGGRVHSEWFSDTVVELGASSSSSGTTVYPFLESAMLDGFINPPISYLSIFDTCDGHKISPTIGVLAYDIFKRICTEASRLETHALDYINFKMEEEVRQFPLEVQQDVTRVLVGILALKYKRQGDVLSRFIKSEQSVHYIQSPGGKLKVPLGYYGIVQPMMSRIPAENIIYNKPVHSVRWGAVVCKDTPRALVKCCDGSVFPADYVIITVSLGVLKDSHDTFFCPSLPSEKVEAIDCMSFGNINKMYFQFSKPFWCWCPKGINIKRNRECLCSKDWTKGISEIQQVSGSNDVLFVLVDGEESNIAEKLSEATIVEAVVKIIEKELKIDKIPCVAKTITSRWTNNVYFKGSYSVIRKEVSKDAQRNLSNPLPGNNAPVSPILLFAGEATCPKLNGTVQAAIVSGIREGARIKKIIDNSKMEVTEEEKLSIA